MVKPPKARKAAKPDKKLKKTDLKKVKAQIAIALKPSAAKSAKGRKKAANILGALATGRIAVAPTPIDGAATSAVLERLYAVILSRRDGNPDVSHSARLLARGTDKVAQKFGEEAVECVIEAVRGNNPQVVMESADVLYHLLVLWVNAGITPDMVWAELHRREGVSGIAEKAARPDTLRRVLGVTSTKIP